MRAYQDMVFSTAARLAGNDSQAEDISQEVLSVPTSISPICGAASRRAAG